MGLFLEVCLLRQGGIIGAILPVCPRLGQTREACHLLGQDQGATRVAGAAVGILGRGRLPLCRVLLVKIVDFGYAD